MKELYVLVISILDKHENRIDSIEITHSNNKNKVENIRTRLTDEINNGEYNEYINVENGETLIADIEVHNDENYELLWIE